MTAGARPAEATGGILRRGTGTLLGSITGGALGFGNAVLVARILGAEGFGLYAIGFALAMIGEALATSGLRTALLHFLPIQRSRGLGGELRGTVIASLAIPAVVSSCIAVLFLSLAGVLARRVFDKPDAAPFIAMVGYALPMMCLSELLGTITRGLGYARYYVIVRNLAQPLTYMMLLGILLAGHGDPGWVTVAYPCSYLVAFGAGVVSVVKTVRPEVGGQRSIYDFRKLYAYSLPPLISTVFYLIIGWADLLMLGAMVAGNQVGIYRACGQMVIPFEMTVVAFNTAAATAYPVLHQEGRIEALRATYQNSVRWISILAIPAFLLLVSQASNLLGLMGPGFSAGAMALSLLVAGQLVNAVLGSAGFLLVLCGHQKIETVNAAFVAAWNILLNVILIPRLGIVGAAATTASCNVLLNGLRVAEVRVLMRLPTLQPALARLASVGVVVALVAYWRGWVASAQAPSNLWSIVGVALAIAASFGTGAWIVGLTQEERSRVKEILASRDRQGQT